MCALFTFVIVERVNCIKGRALIDKRETHDPDRSLKLFRLSFVLEMKCLGNLNLFDNLGIFGCEVLKKVLETSGDDFWRVELYDRLELLTDVFHSARDPILL